jgi:hypothetical protein
VLTICKSNIGAFLLIDLLLHLPWYYPCISFISFTCWVPTISLLNLAISPCHTNLLLRWWWWRILRHGVLGYVLPQLLFLWSYGIFRRSSSSRVALVSNRHYLCNKYSLFMIFGYLWTLYVRMCGINDPRAYMWWVLGFACKIGYDRSDTRAVSTIGMLA